MFMHSWLLTAVGLTLCLAAGAASAEGPNLGKPIDAAAIAAWDISIQPDGTGLPPGGGKAADGARIYADKCAQCHGPDLMGKGDAPPLAGRSASYLARQLYDFQRETRLGRLAPLMRVVVANLRDEDMLAISAYLASLQPVKGSLAPQRPPAITVPVTSTAQR